ncbi:hypothetical protein MRB53_034847 [Persea americana]|uniref:Uncharacterized protein n=1 Tax=Persea americana TaxID=3435 RepID=A0ACC2K313_PERAE|nr:hypothetical protein MRB53_034847 [Persea americana]
MDQPIRRSLRFFPQGHFLPPVAFGQPVQTRVARPEPLPALPALPPIIALHATKFVRTWIVEKSSTLHCEMTSLTLTVFGLLWENGEGPSLSPDEEQAIQITRP